jgi:hypothetical protein
VGNAPIVTLAPSTTYRVVGSEYGGFNDHAAQVTKVYGSEGDVCQHPGCDTILSATNDRDRCYCHGVPGKKRVPRRRGSTSECRSAAPQSAPEPRRVTREEIDMAAAKRQETSDAKRRVLEALTDEYVAAPQIAEKAGVRQANAYYHLKRLVESGVAENKLGNGGGYRLRKHVGAVVTGTGILRDAMDKAADKLAEELPKALARGASSVVEKREPASEAPAGAAPETIDRDPEPAADLVPPAPLTIQQEEPPADVTAQHRRFAGGVDPMEYAPPAWSLPVGQPPVGQSLIVMHSYEIEALCQLEQLDHEARQRVLTYAVARWFCP